MAPNAKRLLLAGFMAIFAAGIGFAIRGGIFANWAEEFGFTGAQLGEIGGAGFTGFCFGIIIGGVVADKIGYGTLVIAAFAFHVLSAFITFGATKGQDQMVAYNYLKWGMFVFALANGVLEAVANPLIATIFPENRTHYLNILHASWPAGLVVGGLAGAWLGDKDGMNWGWKMQLGLYLIPVAIYGLMFFGQEMPKSEASKKGLSLGEMFKDVGILGGLVVCYLLALFFQNSLSLPPAAGYGIAGALLVVIGLMTGFSIGAWLLFALFIAHALVGAVELGTDGWIQNITGNILTPQQGKILFVLTSLGMFALRFCAHWIEKNLKLSPPALLLVCAVLAAIGLNLVSGVSTFGGACAALGVYCLGKTFFWPTMLAVASDRFPRTGAIAISIMGGIGMMSAGLIGSAGLGYAKDRYASEDLKQKNPALYEKYKAKETSKFLVMEPVLGLDGALLSAAQGKKLAERNPEELAVTESSIVGDRKTLQADSFIPMAMAGIYLLLVLFFKATGGYKAVQIEGSETPAKKEGEAVAA
jgi:MFS family permease